MEHLSSPLQASKQEEKQQHHAIFWNTTGVAFRFSEIYKQLKNKYSVEAAQCLACVPVHYSA